MCSLIPIQTWSHSQAMLAWKQVCDDIYVTSTPLVSRAVHISTLLPYFVLSSVVHVRLHNFKLCLQ